MNYHTSKYQILSGKGFNAKYNSAAFIKFTNKSGTKYDFQYKEGLNEDFQEFDPFKICVAGGLHFCKKEDAELWIENYCDQGDLSYYYYWDIEIPDDAVVVETDNKLKTNKIIMKNKRNISENEKLSLIYIKYNSDFFDEINNPSIELVVAKFKQLFSNEHEYKEFIDFIKLLNIKIMNNDILQSIYIKFIEINPHIIIYFGTAIANGDLIINNDEYNILREKAISINMTLLEKFDDLLEITIQNAINICPYNIKYIKNPNEQLLIETIISEPDVYRFIDPNYLTETINLHAIELKSSNIKYIQKDKRTALICKTALYKDNTNLQFVPKDIQEEIFDMVTSIVKNNVKLFKYLSFYDLDICVYAVSTYYENIQFVPQHLLSSVIEEIEKLNKEKINSEYNNKIIKELKLFEENNNSKNNDLIKFNDQDTANQISENICDNSEIENPKQENEESTNELTKLMTELNENSNNDIDNISKETVFNIEKNNETEKGFFSSFFDK
jgi:hypothetical protein